MKGEKYMSRIKALIFDWGDTLMRDFTEFDTAMVYWPKVEIIPGVAEALQELHPRFTCCVASNAGVSDAELMGQALARVDIRQYFHHLYTSRELGAPKPEPGFFMAILERINAAPEECIMVGNDYQKDIAGAKAVGLHTIFLTTETDPTAVPAADVLIDSMQGLVDAVQKIYQVTSQKTQE